jgi:hypothetical protein
LAPGTTGMAKSSCATPKMMAEMTHTWRRCGRRVTVKPLATDSYCKANCLRPMRQRARWAQWVEAGADVEDEELDVEPGEE